MTCNVSYPERIRRRIRLLWLALAAMLVFMVYIGVTGARDSPVVTGFAHQWGNILYWTGLFYIIGRIIINRKLLRDRLRLKEKQLQEYDERNQYLHRMSGGWVMDAMLVINCIAAVAASCYDNKAFYAAFGLLVTAALLKFAAEIAYGKGWLRE